MYGWVKFWNETGSDFSNISIPIQFGWHMRGRFLNVDGKTVAQVHNNVWTDQEFGGSYEFMRIDKVA